jgi:hypothetical protein
MPRGSWVMSDTNQSLRVLAILADADHEAFLASGTAAARPKVWDCRHFPEHCTSCRRSGDLRAGGAH